MIEALPRVVVEHHEQLVLKDLVDHHTPPAALAAQLDGEERPFVDERELPGRPGRVGRQDRVDVLQQDRNERGFRGLEAIEEPGAFRPPGRNAGPLSGSAVTKQLRDSLPGRTQPQLLRGPALRQPTANALALGKHRLPALIRLFRGRRGPG